MPGTCQRHIIGEAQGAHHLYVLIQQEYTVLKTVGVDTFREERKTVASYNVRQWLSAYAEIGLDKLSGTNHRGDTVLDHTPAAHTCHRIHKSVT